MKNVFKIFTINNLQEIVSLYMYKVKINFISEIEIMSIIDRLDESRQKSHIIDPNTAKKNNIL